MGTAASGTSQISHDIADVQTSSQSAGTSSEEVKNAAQALSVHARNLNEEVHDFLLELRKSGK